MGYLMGQAGQYRTRGRRPAGNCVTFELTEGNVQQRRALFRKWKQLVIKNYQSLKESYPEYVLEAINEAGTKSIERKKKNEQGEKHSRDIKENNTKNQKNTLGMTQKEKLI